MQQRPAFCLSLRCAALPAALCWEHSAWTGGIPSLPTPSTQRTPRLRPLSHPLHALAHLARGPAPPLSPPLQLNAAPVPVNIYIQPEPLPVPGMGQTAADLVSGCPPPPAVLGPSTVALRRPPTRTHLLEGVRELKAAWGDWAGLGWADTLLTELPRGVDWGLSSCIALMKTQLIEHAHLALPRPHALCCS